jgi:hypothetical protein
MVNYGYKVIFATFSRDNIGFWLRYTLTNGVRGSKACLWLTIFKPGAPRGFVSCAPLSKLNKAHIHESGEALIGDSTFSISKGIGIARTSEFEWNIKFKVLERPVNTIPPILRFLRRRSSYVMLSPLTLFSGRIRLGNEIFNIDNYTGMIGFTASDRYLHGWVWTHCSGFNEDANGWFDLMVASPSENRWIAFGAIKVDDRLIKLGGLMGETFRGDFNLGFLKYVSKPRGFNVNLQVTARREDIIIAVYEDPVEGHRYCHNSEIASSTLIISRNGYEKVYNCQGRTFYEILTSKVLDQSLPLIKSLETP